MKKLAFCLLLYALLLTLTVPASAASSGEIKAALDSLKQEAQALAQEEAALKQELDANRAETRTTIEKKSALDRHIHTTEAEIQNANAQIQQYSLLIAQKQAELEEAEVNHAQMLEAYKIRIRAMEEAGPISYWSILFHSNSFSDLLSRIDSIREVAEADQRMLKELEALAAEIDRSRQDLEAELSAQQQVKEDLVRLEQELTTQREASDQLILALADAYDSLSEEYLASEAEAEQLQQDIMARQAEYEKALSAEEAARLAQQNQNNAAGGGGTSGASGFTAPLNIGLTVTSAYGNRLHPTLGYWKFHTGVDFAANAGTPIYAIASGSVTTAAYNEANGYTVAIAHGGGFGSMYCHMNSYVVAAGDSVEQGQLIGYVGSTGWATTGPHLHFEIHKDGATVNPMEYIG